MASKMTFHEFYGDVSVAQLRAYKKHNVSPADHDELVRYYGELPGSHQNIVYAIKENLMGDQYSSYHWKRATNQW